MSAAAEVEEQVARRYEIKRRLGKGAYGIVWKAVDRKTGAVVAVKKIFDAFRNRTDAQRTFREIMFLQEFGEHPNIIRLLNVIRAQNDKDIYLVFESMETDLHAVIKKGNLLKDIHKCYILYQLLKATKFIHSGNVIHRDQKPSNILLDADCFVKLCDFGLARSLCQIHQDHDSPALTEYVATRWYRAPEILLSSHRPQVAFEELLPTSTPTQALDLLKRLLVFNPEKRLTVEEALEHPYMRRFHCPSKEPALDYSVVLPLDDDVQLSVAEYRNKLYEMILERKARNRHPQKHQQPQNENLQPSPPLKTRCEAQGVSPPLPSRGSPHLLAPCEASQQKVKETRSLGRLRPGITHTLCSPITHMTSHAHSLAPSNMVRNRSAPLLQQPAAPLSQKVGKHALTILASSPPPAAAPQTTHGVPKGLEVGRSQAASFPRPLSLCAQAQEAALHHHLMRKEGSPGKAAAGLNPGSSEVHSREARSFLKPSKKMFRATANVGMAGDPKACLGSYSQSYGTICKSALQSLPVSDTCQQMTDHNTQQL
ncbi:mitogen-activated protein kinase 15 isoform X2 [Lacerta agilis]|uniref:mitogen-activated protein kinase 15 isoform X2 n=1 Tax=Lacerta agilis TaxID=80427 RepID=UPI00141982AC|nr:mitogen-activated protein kinase 15 isoform X2 [Lacerta agilis]